MSSILFIYVIQAFLDTLHLQNPTIQFHHFPEKKCETRTIMGRLLSQNTNAKVYPFSSTLLFMLMTASSHAKGNKLKQTIIYMNKHFTCFGLIMHLGSESTKSKSEAMYFPPLLTQARDDLTNKSMQQPN